MGKAVIRASDGPGFLVNRCNRPFGLEALRLLQERIADVETIDRICRMEGGFRMGPFELMDLVGVDTGFEVSKSFYEQSFGEPRWRPSPITARYVAAGLLRAQDRARLLRLRRSGPAEHRPTDPAPPDSGAPGKGEGVVVIAGSGMLADELRDAAQQAGYEVRSPHDPTGGVLPALVVDCDGDPPRRSASRRSAAARAPRPAAGAGRRAPAAVRGGSLAALDPGGSAVGFHVLAPLAEAELVELTRSESSSPVAAARAERFFKTLGKHVAWVGDAPGPGARHGSSARSSTSARSRSAKASAARRTSTRAWCSGSATRAARSRGPTRSASTTCCRCWTR